MRTSTERILTTHAGSLARPEPLLELMRDREQGLAVDEARFEALVSEAVATAVRRQAECGLDVVTDGEMGKVSFFTYVKDRLTGFSPGEGPSLLPPTWKAEVDAFPEYYAGYFAKYRGAVSDLREMACTGAVAYVGHDAVRRDITNLASALEGLDVVEAFLPSASPSGFGHDAHYGSEEDYLAAVAEALREEYLAIAGAGYVLQVDDPWLIEVMSDPTVEPAQARRNGEAHVELLNHALRGIPADRVRLHTCYGLNHGPRLHDLPFRDVAELMLRVEVSAYSFEVANPRHQHEWRIWEDVALPDDRVLIPGFLGHATNYVEHPELIADLIVSYAGLVGRERVIAGADCGFSSRATFTPEVHPTVVWAKFQALAEGAALASDRLWR